MLFRLGAIYTLVYSAWKTNLKIYAFILFGNPIVPKVHALNLGAKQLTTIDRAKLVHIIVKLSKVPNANVYTGQLLYRIFITYCKPQVAKCYRTYFHNKITAASLLNYGVNKEEDFSPQDLKVFNQYMYDQAKRDFFIRILDLYSKRGVDLKNVKDKLAKIQTKIPDTKTPQPMQTQEKQVQTQAQAKKPTQTQDNKNKPSGGGGNAT